METIRRHRKSAIIAFLLSLLFHASFMLYLLLQKTDYLSTAAPQTPEEELQQKIKQEIEWAETKARASNFGAPVFFKDEPQTEIETKQQEDEKQEKPIIDTSKLEHHIDIPEPEKIIANVPQQQEAITIQHPRRVKRTPREKEQPIQQPQKSIPQSLPQPKQIPTLAQLTQGFLHQIKDEGTHAVHMLGKKNGRPTDEQMKYERYLQKLNWCLQNSFNINSNRYPSSEQMETEVQVFLALDKDGIMKQLSLVKSSGNRQLDQFVLFIFRDTSSSFPPVPHYLPHDPFTIMYTVMLNSSDNNFRVYRR